MWRMWFCVLSIAALLSTAFGKEGSFHVSLTGPDYYGVTFGGGEFVIVGAGGTILTSQDGSLWLPPLCDTHPACIGIPIDLLHVVFGRGKFLALAGINVIYESKDGDQWTLVKNLSDLPYLFQTLAYGNGHFLMGGVQGRSFFINTGTAKGVLAISSDGEKWTIVEFDQEGAGISDVLFTGGEFVATTLSGKVLVSKDAMNWIIVPTGFSTPLNDIAYGNGKYIAVGWNGSILVSSNARNWRAVRTIVKGHINAVSYGGGYFVAVGDDGVILVSETGETWKTYSTGLNPDFRDVYYAHDFFLVVGEDGVILRLEPRKSPGTHRSSSTPAR